MGAHCQNSVVLIILTCLVPSVAVKAADVTVDTTTLHAIAGESRIPQGIFGGTANNNTGMVSTGRSLPVPD